MKPALLGLTLGLLLLARPAWADPDPALAVVIAQLNADLLLIPAGGEVTDAQHQALLADLTALSVGILPAPDAADLAEVATTLEAAALAGNVTADTLVDLNEDLADNADNADDADFWLDDILSDAQVLQHLQDPPVGDPSLPIETGSPIFTTAASLRPRRTSTDRRFSLDDQQGQSPANQYYYGEVELITRRVAGGQATTRLYVEALGLPLNNPYTVAIVRRSDGAHLMLGQASAQEVPVRDFNLYLPGDVPDTYRQKLENLTLIRTRLTDDDFGQVLPEGLNPLDVSKVTLTDAQGVTRLAGEFRTAGFHNQTRSVVLHLRGAPAAAPAATAVAKAKRFAVGNSASHLFSLTARHLPASTQVTLLADGVAQGQFTTGKNGRLYVTQGTPTEAVRLSGKVVYPQTLPKTLDFSRVKSLALIDSKGRVLATSDE